MLRKSKKSTILTEADVEEIRRMYHEDLINTSELCHIWSCGYRRIKNILHNTSSEVGGHVDRPKKTLNTQITPQTPTSSPTENKNENEFGNLLENLNLRMKQADDRKAERRNYYRNQST